MGDTIQIEGENLNTVQTIAVDVYNFPIVEQSNTLLKVVVPRIVEGGPFTISNVYKRQNETTQVLQPQFYPAVVQTWPTEIERGKPFVLKGQNMDLVLGVKINGSAVALMGSVSPDKVAYATAGIVLGDLVVIEVTPKTGEKQSSAEIAVVECEPYTSFCNLSGSCGSSGFQCFL